MRHQANFKQMVNALCQAVDMACKLAEQSAADEDPRDVVAEFVAGLAKDGEIGPLREWFEEVEKKVVVILVEQKGVRSHELGRILGTSVEAACQYLSRKGMTLRNHA